MQSIAIVGDVHIWPSVVSRTDDYLESVLDKIHEISSKYNHVIFLGDLFDKPVVPLSCYGKVWNLLSYCENCYRTNYYSIIGNHDIPNELESALDQTALGLLEEQGVIKVIKVDEPIEIEGIKFHTVPVNFKSCKEYLHNNIGKYNEKDIVLMHQYYEDEFECLSYEDIKDLGCKTIFFGHHHRPFDHLRKVYDNGLTLYRGGSLGRNKAEEFNFTRDIYYFSIEGGKISPNTVECVKQATEIFKPEALHRDNLKKKEFIRSINDVIQKYTNNISTENKFSIKTILKELNTPIKNMSYIESIYNKLSERFD